MSASAHRFAPRLSTALAASAVLALLFSTVLAAQASDPFYTELERQGRAALAREQAAESAHLLRIACFGLLDAPERLAGCLVRLALAEGRIGDREGFERTFRRLEQLEERFGALRATPLSPEERAELARHAAESIPPELLQSSSLAALFASWAPAPEPAERSAESGAKRRKATKAEREEPPSEELAAQLSAPQPLTTADEASVARARQAAGTSSDQEELEALFLELSTLADAHAGDVSLQHLTASLAYRVSRWSVCADYFRRGGEPTLDDPLLRFYMAICLYESGDPQGAASLLAGSVERLKRTPFVERYLAKILGGTATSSP